MTEFVSEIKQIPQNDDRILAMLTDLSNLERVKDRIPQGKLTEFTFDSDSGTIAVEPVGQGTFQLVERETNKTIKMQTTDSPMPVTLWIQLKQVAEMDTRMKLTVRADIPVFLKSMVAKPLQDALNKISEMLAVLPY